MNQRSPFWNLLLVASCVAAAVSLLTTGIGLARYLAAPLAWPLAVAVQMGLFGLAWLIAVRQVKLRALVITLYCLTMPFSVVFSYVMLQSEFTAEIRPQETQRQLFDDLRQRSAAVVTEIDKSLAETDELELRLASWLEMEQSEGWTTATCDASSHCYLSSVCARVQGRIDSWETRFGLPYPQGPGEALIYGSLETEQAALEQIGERLRAARQQWGTTDRVFAPDLDNRDRLRQFDLALADVPQRDLQAVRCDTVALPTAPRYVEFARDDLLREEEPVYAFEDLAAVFSPAGPFSRSDYPTVFALFLAIFIDLFVLLVAIGAAVVAEADPAHLLSPTRPIVPEWGEGLSREITAWIDGALLHGHGSMADRRAFLAGVIQTLRFDNSNRVLFTACESQDRRFGYLMTTAKAATPSPAGADAEGVTFVLEDWVYPALARYMATA